MIEPIPDTAKMVTNLALDRSRAFGGQPTTVILLKEPSKKMTPNDIANPQISILLNPHQRSFSLQQMIIQKPGVSQTQGLIDIGNK